MPLLMPVEGLVAIPLNDINDGKAHHYQVKAADDIVVTFFVLKSQDGVIRAAIDACDVCYRSGKGYKQDGNDMVCQNCGHHFSSNKINVIKGGCNPAPLERKIEGKNLVIAMNDINKKGKISMVEIGIFRAIGFRRSHVMQIILLEAIVVGLIGGLLGFVGGNSIAWAVLPLVLPGSAFVGVNFQVGAVTVLLSVALSLLASLYPAHKGSQLDPSDALRTL